MRFAKYSRGRGPPASCISLGVVWLRAGLCGSAAARGSVRDGIPQFSAKWADFKVAKVVRFNTCIETGRYRRPKWFFLIPEKVARSNTDVKRGIKSCHFRRSKRHSVIHADAGWGQRRFRLRPAWLPWLPRAGGRRTGSAARGPAPYLTGTASMMRSRTVSTPSSMLLGARNMP